MLSRFCAFMLVVVVPVALVGCAENRLTRQNYDMIKVGTSTRMEVEHTLGDKYEARGNDQWEYEAEEQHLAVMIHFDDSGKVQKKEWIDGKTGEWHTDPPEPSKGRLISDESSNATIDKDD